MAETQTPTSSEYPHWPRVYILVGVYTLVLIIALLLFSSAFAS